MQWTYMSRLILNSIHMLRRELEKDQLSVVNLTGTGCQNVYETMWSAKFHFPALVCDLSIFHCFFNAPLISEFRDIKDLKLMDE